MTSLSVATLTGHADTVASICFGIGALLVLAGTVIGLVLSFKGANKPSKEKVEDAITKTHQLKTTAKEAAESQNAEPAVAKSADDAGGAIEGVLKEVAGTIGALPEQLRFSGLVVLVGLLLMSVAVVQFGGHSIF
jgi:hypothetical protein